MTRSQSMHLRSPSPSLSPISSLLPNPTPFSARYPGSGLSTSLPPRGRHPTGPSSPFPGVVKRAEPRTEGGSEPSKPLFTGHSESRGHRSFATALQDLHPWPFVSTLFEGESGGKRGVTGFRASQTMDIFFFSFGMFVFLSFCGRGWGYGSDLQFGIGNPGEGHHRHDSFVGMRSTKQASQRIRSKRLIDSNNQHVGVILLRWSRLGSSTGRGSGRLFRRTTYSDLPGSDRYPQSTQSTFSPLFFSPIIYTIPRCLTLCERRNRSSHEER